MADLSDEKYVSFTTFTKDGRPKPAPVWIVDLGDGTWGFNTQSDSWKVKRLRNDPNVKLQACKSSGAVTAGSPEVNGTAVVVDGPSPVVDKVRAAVKSKYGFQVTMIDLGMKLQGIVKRSSGERVAVVIEPVD